MNPWMQIPHRPPGKFQVGQSVRLKHIWRGVIGEVVEDRGPIGYRGRRLYGVRVRLDQWNEHVAELAEESLEAVDGDPEASPPTDGKKAKGPAAPESEGK